MRSRKRPWDENELAHINHWARRVSRKLDSQYKAHRELVKVLRKRTCEAVRARLVKATRALNGLCLCGRELKPDCVSCIVCLDKAAVRKERFEAANRAAGLCRCGKPRMRGRKQCQSCRRINGYVAQGTLSLDAAVHPAMDADQGQRRLDHPRQRPYARSLPAGRSAAAPA